MPLNRSTVRLERGPAPVGNLGMAAIAVVALFGAACSRSAPETAIHPEAAPTFIVNGPADLPPDTFVRYHTVGQWFGVRVGRVAEATADTLWIRDRDMFWRKTRRAVPVARLRDLHFTRTDYPKEDKVGMAMAAGAVTFWMLAVSLPPRSTVEEEAVGGVLEFYAVTLGSLATGIMFALVIPGDKYEPVPLPARPR